MKLTINVADRVVGVDGEFLHLPALDWSRFGGTVEDPWDDIEAVQYDTELGQGHVEYRAIVTRQPGRPNLKAPDWHIGPDDFTTHFGWVIEAWTARRAEVEEMERMRAAQEPPPPPAESQELIELRARVAEMEATLERLGHSVAKTLGIEEGEGQ